MNPMLELMAADDGLLDEFCDALWLEDGLSRNTLESYRRDLRLFAVWLASARGKTRLNAERVDLWLPRPQVPAPCQAALRGAAALSLKRLYQFLLRGQDNSRSDIASGSAETAAQPTKNRGRYRTAAPRQCRDALGLRDKACWRRCTRAGCGSRTGVRVRRANGQDMGVVRIVGKDQRAAGTAG